MPTLMLIDGNSLTYRAFFALPTDMATASGQVTNAVFGFTSMLVNLVRDHRPDRVVVAFDRPEPTFRHERLPSYKANRSETPDILRQQMGLVRQVVQVLGLPVVEQAGYEADDLIATLATESRDRGEGVIVVTGDRDSYQLVEDPHIRVLYNRRGVSDYVLYDEAGILDRTGVRADQYLWYAALRGDPSDNLPGVPGVGEKTAARLVTTYADLDGIFAHVDELSPKLAGSLKESEERIRTNAELMVLIRDVPLDVDPEQLNESPVDTEEVRRLFGFLEFNSLLGRLGEAFGDRMGGEASGLAGDRVEVLEAEVTVCERDDDVARALEAARSTGGSPVGVAGAWTGAPGRSTLVGLAVVVDPAVGEVAWIPAGLLGASDPTGRAEVGPSASPVAGFLADGPGLAAHDAKPLLRSLAAWGLELGGLSLDTKLAAYLLDPAETRYDLDELLARFANAELAGDPATGDGQLALDMGSDPLSVVTCRRALGVARLAGPIQDALDAQGLAELNTQVEVPLVGVLARMEHLGVGVDAEELRRLRDELVSECERLRGLIVSDAGEEFNVNSTPQLRSVLFDKLGLHPQKKTKTGFSTDQATLEKLRGEHPIIEHLLDYREVEKLRSTYGEGLLAEVGPDGRIHATFNQTVARTGRLSSDAPNLHNIPVRTEEGRRFRRAFVPAPGFEFCVADYNQIELRCIAHLAEDPGLMEAFGAGTDIHAATASRVFGVAESDVTAEQRSKAKMVSYGLAYGMEAYGLGQRLNIPAREAQEILDAYFAAFPAVRSYMERTVAEARERGYTETLFGRRRRIPELSSTIRSVRMAGERQAMNAGIQGLAADIFKVALVRLDRELRARGSASRIVLQVHDEIVVEVPPGEHDEQAELIPRVMGAAFPLRVPLAVNLAFGANWAEAKA